MQALSGSLGIALNPSRAFTLYGNVGSSFETPTTTELANSPSGAGGFNTGLNPQKAVNYEVGARGTLGERFSYTGALFQANVRDALVPYEIAAPRFYYRNAGSTRHRGVELSGSAQVLAGLSVNVIWTTPTIATATTRSPTRSARTCSTARACPAFRRTGFTRSCARSRPPFVACGPRCSRAIRRGIW
jgi:outer membrane receptor protein involved in Fe transport